MSQRLKKFRGLVQNSSEFGMFLRIGLWILLVTILLRLAPLPRMMKILSPSKISRRRFPRHKLVNFSSFWLGRGRAFLQRSCLKRSLVLYRYLNLQGEPARFCIGVRKEDGELRGHSWIMLHGQPLFPEDDLDYKLIFQYPAPGGWIFPRQPSEKSSG